VAPGEGSLDPKENFRACWCGVEGTELERAAWSPAAGGGTDRAVWGGRAGSWLLGWAFLSEAFLPAILTCGISCSGGVMDARSALSERFFADLFPWQF